MKQKSNLQLRPAVKQALERTLLLMGAIYLLIALSLLVNPVLSKMEQGHI